MTEQQETKAVHLFHDGLDLLGIRLSEERISQLVTYCLELQKWNKRVNLVAKNTSLRDLVEKHFIDSLTLLAIVQKYGRTGSTLLDVGSGAGFPGLVVAIACPTLDTILLEPRQRRVSFLNHIIRSLSLTNTRVIMDRIEDISLPAEHDYSIITSRAVAEIPVFLEMASSRAGQQTIVVCMQGEGGKQHGEIRNRDLEFSRVGTEEYTLPFSGAKRYLLLYRKGD